MITVRYVNPIEGSPIVGFLARAWVALLNDNLWDRRNILLSGDLSCVYAVEGKKIIGVITFFLDEDEHNANINLAFVHPRHRRQGVMRAMWAEMLKQVKAQKASWVSNVCYPHNDGIQEFCKSVGGYEYTRQYRVDIR